MGASKQSSFNGFMKMMRFYWLWSILLSLASLASKTFSLNLKSPNDKIVNCSSQNEKAELSNICQNQVAIQIIKQTQTQKQNQPSGIMEYIPKFLKFQFHKKKLVLDLDETLISSSARHSPKHDISVKVYLGGAYSTFYVRKRPHVDLFLETVSQWFELVIFTASISVYANAVIDKLDPKGHINRRFYRQSCVQKSGSYIKDLQIVCKDLSKVVIIDNSPIAYSFNKENAIPIDDYFGNNAQDESLLNLLPLLDKLRESDDVRHVLKSSKDQLILSNGN